MSGQTSYLHGHMFSKVFQKHGLTEKHARTFMKTLGRDPDEPFAEIARNQLRDVAMSTPTLANAPFVVNMPMHLDEASKSKLETMYPHVELKHNPRARDNHCVVSAARLIDQEIFTRSFPKEEAVVDLGGNYSSHLMRGDSNVHCCTPIRGARDVGRYVSADKQLETHLQVLKPGPKHDSISEYLADSKGFKDTRYRCLKHGQDCSHPARYMMSVHTLCETGLQGAANAMLSHGSTFMYGSLIASPAMLEEHEGYFPELNGRYSIDPDRDAIDISFVDDSSYAYSYKYSEFCKYFAPVLIKIQDARFLYEVVERTSATLYFRITRLEDGSWSDLDSLDRVWVVERPARYEITSFTRDHKKPISDLSCFVPHKIEVPASTWNRLMQEAMHMSDARFSREELFRYARSLNNRVTLNGGSRITPETLDAEPLDALVTAAYLRAFDARRDMAVTTRKITSDILRERRAVDSGIVGLVSEATAVVLRALFSKVHPFAETIERLQASTNLDVSVSEVCDIRYISAETENAKGEVLEFPPSDQLLVARHMGKFESPDGCVVVPGAALDDTPVDQAFDIAEREFLLEMGLDMDAEDEYHNFSDSGSEDGEEFSDCQENALPSPIVARPSLGPPPGIPVPESISHSTLQGEERAAVLALLHPGTSFIGLAEPVAPPADESVGQGSDPEEAVYLPSSPGLAPVNHSPEEVEPQNPSVTTPRRPEGVCPTPSSSTTALPAEPPGTPVHSPDPYVKELRGLPALSPTADWSEQSDDGIAFITPPLTAQGSEDTADSDIPTIALDGRGEPEYVRLYNQAMNSNAGALLPDGTPRVEPKTPRAKPLEPMYAAPDNEPYFMSSIAEYLAITQSEQAGVIEVLNEIVDKTWARGNICNLRQPRPMEVGADYLHLDAKGRVLSTELNDSRPDYSVAFDPAYRQIVRSYKERTENGTVLTFPSRRTGTLLVISKCGVFNYDRIASVCSGLLRKKRIPCPPTTMKLFEGVPGCGKTYSLTKSYKPGDLVLSATRATCDEIRDNLHLTGTEDAKAVRTVDSFLINPNYKVAPDSTLMIDEALMVHAGAVYACICLSKARKVIFFGDREQIPYVNRTSKILSYSMVPATTFSVELSLDSKRCPVDVSCMVSHLYERSTGKRMTSSSSVMRSVTCTPAATIKDAVRSRDAKGTVYLTFLQNTKAEVEKLRLIKDRGAEVKSVHEAQGKTYKHVVLVLAESHKVDLATKDDYCLVALTRHTHTFELRYHPTNSSDCKIRNWRNKLTGADVADAVKARDT